jgi:hypothetical protein
MMQVIGSLLLVSAVAGAVVAAVHLTGRRDPDTGRPKMTRVGRIAVAIGAALGASAVATPILTATGLSPSDHRSAVEELRDGLRDRGFSAQQTSCVEARLVQERGSVDAAAEAAQDDVKVMLRPLIGCRGDFAVADDEMVDCYAAAVVARFDLDNMSAAHLAEAVARTTVEDRRYLSAASLVCQGLPQDIADCVVERVISRYPDVYDAGRTLTTDQQQFMRQAAVTCADD